MKPPHGSPCARVSAKTMAGLSALFTGHLNCCTAATVFRCVTDDTDNSNKEGGEPRSEAMAKARLKAFADLLILRFFSATPGLVSYMLDSGVVNGAVEFSFWHLPEEVVLDIRKLSGCEEIEVYKFFTRGSPCTGFRFHPAEADLDDFEIAPSEEDEDVEEKPNVVQRITTDTESGGASATTSGKAV